MSSILLKMDKNVVEHATTAESGNSVTMLYVIIGTDNRMDDDDIDFHHTDEPVKRNKMYLCIYKLPLG